jgi:3-phenylpropionate/trans-cinnamate dioxygenase ferredoxin reductase subunit
MTTLRIVVVGGGVAGASAVAELRRAGFDGAITLVCAEHILPYERPPLSKEFLLDAATGPATVADGGWYKQQSIDMLLGTRATELDPTAKTLTLTDGATLGYDSLLLATGVRPRTLPGIDGERVCYLRTIKDATRLREQISAAQHVAVLGGGFIGCEVAAAALRLGKQVTILEALPTLLQRVLGTTLGDVLTALHREEGVDVRTEQVVTGINPHHAGLVVSTGQGTLECDLLVVGAGTVPNQELAQQAGVAVGNGIFIDQYCVTDAPDVYAVGDVAAQDLPSYGRRTRVEHHDTAIRQGAVAARNMLGAGEAFTDVHWFWSDQYEHSIQSAGIGDDPENVVIRGSLEQRNFAAFQLAGDQIRSVLALNRPRDIFDTRRIMATHHSVTAEQLADDSTPLKRLTRPRPIPAT